MILEGALIQKAMRFVKVLENFLSIMAKIPCSSDYLPR